jgi:PST family polysaccharide transporter
MDIKKILKNSFILFLMKRHYFLMFLIVPFLIKKVGIENFGKLEYCKSIAYYFNIFINFGFNFISTKKIQKDPENLENLSLVFFSTFFCKIILILISIPIFIFIYNEIEFIKNFKNVFLLFFLVSIFSSLNPVFIYQGTNLMQNLFFFDIFTKIFLISIVFFFIKKESDFFIYPLGYFISDFFRFVFVNIWIYKKKKLKFFFPSKCNIFSSFKESYSFFFSNISRTIYERLPQIIIGSCTSIQNVGIYTVGTKVIGELNLYIGQFIQAYFPFFSKEISENFVVANKKTLKIFIIFSFIIFFTCTNIFIFSENIVIFFSKKNIVDTSKILKLASFIPFFVFIYNFLGVNFLSFKKKEKLFSFTIFSISSLTMAIIFFSKIHKSFFSIVSIIVFSEMTSAFLIILYFLFFSKKNYN